MTKVFSELYSSDANLIPRTYTIGSGNLRGKMKKDDFWPDASLLGLVYPSGILEPTDRKMQKTAREIIRRNTTENGGLLRYPGDRYCGGVKNGWVTLTGAGAWPLLSFWMAIYFHLNGDTKNAEKHLRWPLERIEKYIPEQIFIDNLLRKWDPATSPDTTISTARKKASICPLAWSHSMFVIAANFLGYL
jgi:GH15 family glucan-1,4-alpha-glucosidase